MALIPPFFLDTVAAIGRLAGDGSVQWTASGFLYGEYEATDGDSKRYRMYLVTNRHVVDGQQAIVVRFSSQDAALAPFINLSIVEPGGSPSYVLHPDPDIDVAVLPMNVALLQLPGTKFSFFQSDAHTLDRAEAVGQGLAEGDGAYVLGFPMGQVGGERNYVIVRQGVLARVRDWLAGGAKEFLVDAPVFPGNSGGPVVTRPEMVSIEGTAPRLRADLIGVVKAYVPYRDVAISSQTGRQRIVFEENSGLTAVVPFDFVREVVRLQMSSNASPAPSVNTPDVPSGETGPSGPIITAATE